MRASPADANRALTSTLACVLVLAFGACKPGEPTGPTSGERVRVRTFTEATPVAHILAVPPFAFAATGSGIDRWDLRNGQALHLGAADGLPGERVQSLDVDRQKNELWVATEVGLSSYDLAQSVFREMPPPPSVLGIDSFEGATVAAVGGTTGGAWVGLARGLFQVTRDGTWSATGITAPVSDLLVEADGALWIATSVGLFVSRNGVAAPLGADRGCDLASVRFIVQGPDARLVAVGENAAGRQRIALIGGDQCSSFRASPDRVWRAAASRAGELMVLTDDRLYSVRRPTIGGRTLVRDGMQLLPVPRADGERPMQSPFMVRPQNGAMPAGAQSLAAVENEVLVGTRSLGTARVGGSRSLQWLRRAELVGEGNTLSVACVAREDCYVATGSRRAWRFDGEHFAQTGGGERRVLSVTRTPDGRVLGLRQTPDGRRIALADVRGDEWRDMGITLETPGADPEVSFARFSPSGVLWVGLRFDDQEGEPRPYGVALVDVALGAVAYHHASHDEREAARGVLSIPIDVNGVDFHGEDEAWLSTSQGAAQLIGQKVVVFGEAEGMASEILRGVACSDAGTVYVATSTGVGAFDGERWLYPRLLAQAVNDLEIGPDGRLWMATERGLAVYDGARVRRLDARRGLVENRIRDVAIDQYGRVWLRGTQSLGIVTP